jgi:hypothetical protein
MKKLLGGVMALMFCTVGGTEAQDAIAPNDNVADYFSAAFLAEHVPALMEKARNGDGTGTLLLKRFPGNYMNLMVRTKTGIGEMHAQWSDVLIAIDGEADIITGGILVDRTDGKGGESRGTRSEGGTHHVMHKGDIIHIMPGVAHWTVLPPGGTFTFFAVKIQAPEQGSTSSGK